MKSIEELNAITEHYQQIYKEAAKDTFDITGKIKDIVDIGSKVTSFGAKYVGLPIIAGIPVAAATAGAIASKVGSPAVLAENADKYILRSALDAEIVTMERKIADELLRRKKEQETKYDRFI